MNLKTTLVYAFAILVGISSCTSHEGNVNYANNASPLYPARFIELPLGSISADG